MREKRGQKIRVPLNSALARAAKIRLVNQARMIQKNKKPGAKKRFKTIKIVDELGELVHHSSPKTSTSPVMTYVRKNFATRKYRFRTKDCKKIPKWVEIPHKENFLGEGKTAGEWRYIDFQGDMGEYSAELAGIGSRRNFPRRGRSSGRSSSPKRESSKSPRSSSKSPRRSSQNRGSQVRRGPQFHIGKRVLVLL